MTIPQESINYMACTIFGEARGESIEGLVAVGNVIMNRAIASKNSVKEICIAPKQFSCWNQDEPNFDLVRNLLSQLENGDEIKDPYIRQCIAVARAICNEDFLDNTHSSKNYVTVQRHQLAKARNAGSDQWILRMKPVVIIGKHVFLSESGKSKISNI